MHKDKMPGRKWCFVPNCTNTSNKTPLKIFVTVPRAMKRREKWFAAVRRNIKEISSASVVYCCEDHFHLEKDMENYMEYKLSNVRARMKPDVVPHKFACQLSRNLLSTKPSQLSKIIVGKKDISDYIHQSEAPSTTEHVQENISEPVSTSSTVCRTYEKACQTQLIQFTNKSIQTTLKLDVGTSTTTFRTAPKQSLKPPRKRLRLKNEQVEYSGATTKERSNFDFYPTNQSNKVQKIVIATLKSD